MSKGKKSADWWDTFLYIGCGILIFIFLYQLLKLWNAGQATAANFGQAIAQAAANTVGAIESGFESLVTAPSELLAGITGGFTGFLSLIGSFFSAFDPSGFIASIGTAFSSLFSFFIPSTPPPTTNGQGSNALQAGTLAAGGSGNDLDPTGGEGFSTSTP